MATNREPHQPDDEGDEDFDQRESATTSGG
jgi:hypothetical protein